MVSAAIITGDISPPMILTEQRQHFIVKDFTVLDTAEQRLLRAECHSVLRH